MSLFQLESNEYNKYSGAKFAYKTDTKINHMKDDKLVFEDLYPKSYSNFEKHIEKRKKYLLIVQGFIYPRVIKAIKNKLYFSDTLKKLFYNFIKFIFNRQSISLQSNKLVSEQGAQDEDTIVVLDSNNSLENIKHNSEFMFFIVLKKAYR